MSLPGSPRLPYDRLPAGLRAAIDAVLGSPVVAVSARTGGFSPGPAAVVTSADGRRAFVKAVGTPLNPDTPRLLRAEALVMAGLPASLPVPPLRAHVEWADGPDEWVALAFEAFDGDSAPLPWTPQAAAAVVDGLTELARAATPCPVPDLPTLGERVDGPLSAWAELAAEPPSDLHPWEAESLEWLGAVPDRLAAGGWLGGDTLVHGDLRADNLLFGADASVAFVDWAWAVRGADWVDTVLFALDAATQGGVDPEWLVGRSPLVAAAEPRQVTDLVVAMTGMWARSMRRPPPPGLPTLRSFQRAFHDTALAWSMRRVAAGLV
ncbi:Phosphotransferase enzyme family protein [Blastococcus aurantiacus]|uniref:Phosphotransferase enzyme family protein n=1 Tax=Blastococcus aurantiacus TaxID=1550231 RepID=A0A1G7LJP5_9ACTN|nr:phosphotransferase [Blastococcus aurantiacus]SDF49616.1 Phosphotransferase enzyme family protein [Blastococcus aurantiacus]